MTELSTEEAAIVERFERAPDALVEDLRDEVATAATHALVNVSRLPEWMQVPALGRHMRPLGDLVADALLPLIAQREAEARADERERVAQEFDARAESRYLCSEEHKAMGDYDTAVIYARTGSIWQRAARIARGDA